jgi:lipopolysaccharide biosynthesis glycosyltransferase
MEVIDLLFTLDNRYLFQLKVLLTSLHINNPNEKFRIYLIHKKLSKNDLNHIFILCQKYGYPFFPIKAEESLFSNAPVTAQYPQEMYYRMLAAYLLPSDVKKVIYLDPDTLIINPIQPLWETDITEYLFAAAAHSGKTELVHSVNRIRLKTQHDYYNSGVLVINLDRCRQEIVPEKLFTYAKEHADELILPDQDMINLLFGTQIPPLVDVIWNYDARDYKGYYICSNGKYDLDWVMCHTAILHFCGKAKPWKKGYLYRFGLLYKHYEQLTRRQMIS